jgi:predicted acylesterase/phospholipase RssA
MYSSNTLITEYVDILIENLPNKFKQLGHIDLILEGGMFNGSYLVGALYFLKEMEKRNYIIIDRISGCSIGSILGFLYYVDALDLILSLYITIKKEFTETCHLNMIKNLKSHLQSRIPPDICSYINGKLYICYYNIKKRKKKVKHTYKNIDVLINTIIKSCFVPFVIHKSCFNREL